MANEGLATMLRVQQYVNTFGNPEAVSIQQQQPSWSGDSPDGNNIGYGAGVSKHENVNQSSPPPPPPPADSSSVHKFTPNGHPSDEAEVTHASHASLETATADVPELPADECWLFKCPKRSSTTATAHEPIQSWLRAVFDSPSSTFYSSRRNLLTRLEIILASGGPIDAYRFGGSVPSLNQFPASIQKTAKPAPCVRSSMMMMNSNRRIVSAGSSDSLAVTCTATAYSNGSLGGTFGKLTKPKYSLPPQYSTSGSQRIDSLTNLSTGTPNLSLSLGGLLTGSPGKSGSLDELEKNASRTNIQEIARIQEDNLKAEVAAMAAAAAASGRHGSHQSLTSLGRRSPEGSHSHVPSAPESPHSSNPQLAPTVGHVHRPTVDLSSTTFASYMIPESVKCQAPGVRTVQPPQAHVPRVSHPTDPRIAHNGNGQLMNGLSVRHSYSPLPQKPTIPVSTGYRQTSTDNVATEPSVSPNTNLQQPSSAQSIEPRNQFGFRSIRRIPAPQPTTQLPPAPRRITPTGGPIADGSV